MLLISEDKKVKINLNRGDYVEIKPIALRNPETLNDYDVVFKVISIQTFNETNPIITLELVQPEYGKRNTQKIIYRFRCKDLFKNISDKQLKENNLLEYPKLEFDFYYKGQEDNSECSNCDNDEIKYLGVYVVMSPMSYGLMPTYGLLNSLDRYEIIEANTSDQPPFFTLVQACHLHDDMLVNDGMKQAILKFINKWIEYAKNNNIEIRYEDELKKYFEQIGMEVPSC